ncbi:MAG: hypothetical protein IAE86_19775 [Burkholderiaceae bacterium]|nr:hypothetical protein [Burkholderiaceae bacterium]
MSAGGMCKLVVLHDLLSNNDRPALERWFRRQHCPEVLAQAPWMTRYVMYRCQPPPPGAEGLACFNYRVHENWVRGSDERRGVAGLLSMSPQPGEMDVVLLTVPAEPSDDFLGADLRFDDTTILRWMQVIAWPDGVDEAAAESWYLNVHAPEVCRQPGLIRFFSHRAAPSSGPPIPSSAGQRPFVSRLPPLFGKRWRRLTELWYANDAAWIRAVLEQPPHYTPPPWGPMRGYPFLEPGSDFVSAFLLEHPDQNLLRDCEHRMF